MIFFPTALILKGGIGNFLHPCKKDSLKRKKSLLKLSSVVENLREEDTNKSFVDMLLPDFNRLAAPMLYDDLRREIKVNN